MYRVQNDRKASSIQPTLEPTTNGKQSSVWVRKVLGKNQNSLHLNVSNSPDQRLLVLSLPASSCLQPDCRGWSNTFVGFRIAFSYGSLHDMTNCIAQIPEIRDATTTVAGNTVLVCKTVCTGAGQTVARTTFSLKSRVNLKVLAKKYQQQSSGAVCKLRRPPWAPVLTSVYGLCGPAHDAQ